MSSEHLRKSHVCARAAHTVSLSRCLLLSPAVTLVLLLVLLTTTILGRASAPWPPEKLSDTGLYADISSKTVRPDNLPFSPQYPLWSDGAEKTRWINLPQGSSIDASNPDVWQFPIGTRLWKEFRFGRRAETRFIERTPGGWQFATYAWNDDESDAMVVPEQGILHSVLIRDGVHHSIPSRIDCRACHEAGAAPVLGFSALQLSPERDPNAPHAEPLPPGAVDLRTLVERGLLRGLPPQYLQTPPKIDAPTPTARAALGYLHANCGICHNSAGPMASLGMLLNYPLARPAGQPAPALWTTAGQPSQFRLTDALDVDAFQRISPGDPDGSVLIGRVSSRQPVLQMPPLGTKLVDEQAVELLRHWVGQDIPNIHR